MFKPVRLLWALLCRLVLILACLIFGISCFALLAKYPWLGFIVAVGTAWKRCRRGFGSGWHHGTATLAGWGDLIRGKCVADDGLILGTAGYIDRPSRRFAFAKLLTAPLRESVLAVRLFLASIWGPRWSRESLIRVKDSVHLATFAKTRGGKGVSVVIPTLLSYKGSMVVTDPKAENVKITAKHRRKKFGHRVVKLAPFRKDSYTYDPLDWIDHRSPDLVDQCRDLAVAMVFRTGMEHETHFLDSAESILQACIALVCVTAPPEMRNLQTVRELVASRERFAAAVKLMQESGDVAGGMLQRLGHKLTWHEGKEQASVMSTVQRVTGWPDSPPIAANTSRSSFDPKELKNGKMSVHLCLPPERLTSHAAILRMWISSIMRAVTVGGDESRQTLFLLDEVGNMGHLQALEDAVTRYSGMGIRLWFIFQSLDQVKAIFCERANTFLDNIGTQQFFIIQSYSTDEEISRRLGEMSVVTESEQDGTSDSTSYGGQSPGGNSGSRSSSRSRTSSEMARKLLKPEEITTMNSEMSIIFHHANPAILARRIKYYNSPLFRTLLPGRFRTGGTPGTGLGGGIAAAAVLLASLILAGLLASLPTVRLPEQSGRANRPVMGGGYRYPPSYAPSYGVNRRFSR